MYTFFSIASGIAIALTLCVTILLLGGVAQMTEDFRMKKKLRSFVLIALLFVIEVLFVLLIGRGDLNLIIIFGVLLFLMLAYLNWKGSKLPADKEDRWAFIFIQVALFGCMYLSKILTDATNDYEWEHKEIYVVQPVGNKTQADTLYIFDGKIITKPD